MRIEGSVTAISWIPSEAIEGLPKLPFEFGVGHYDEPPPDRLSPGDLGRRDRRHGLRRGRPGRLDDVPLRAEGDRRPGSAIRGPATRAGDLPRPGPLRTDRGRACGLPGASTRERRPLVPHPFGNRVDDAGAHAARRRSHRARTRGCEPVPVALDLRQRRRPRAEERHRRLQDLVPRVARRQHAVGRRGVAGARRGGGDRARAGAVAQPSHRRRQARAAQARRRRDPRRAGR